MSEEDSDVAPMSPLVDTPTPEEEKKIEKSQVEKAVRFASSPSASEDELSGAESSKKTSTQIGPNLKQNKKELIDTSTSGRQKKNITYKGVKVQSDEEEEAEEEAKRSQKSSDKEDSCDSAEEYFNQQRKLIKKKLIGNKVALKEFDKEDVASVEDQVDEDEQEDERNWDEDMEDFDNLMEQSQDDAQKLIEEEERKAKEEQERLR